MSKIIVASRTNRKEFGISFMREAEKFAAKQSARLGRDGMCNVLVHSDNAQEVVRTFRDGVRIWDKSTSE